MNAEILRLGCYARINVSTRMASFPCVILVPLRLPRKCEFKECIRPINLAINKKKEEEEKRGTLSTSFSFTRHVRHSRVNKSRGKIKEGKRERKRFDYYSNRLLFNASSRENKPSNNFNSSFLSLSPFPLRISFSFSIHEKGECNFCSIFDHKSNLRPPATFPNSDFSSNVLEGHDTSIGMTPGLSILVPVSDKGNEGPVLTFVVRGEYYFLALPASPRPLIFLFLPRLARPILSSLPISFSSAYPLSPSIVHRLTAASPRLAPLPSSPSPFFSVPPSLCLLESIRHRKARNRAGIYESMPYDKVLVTILSEL